MNTLARWPRVLLVIGLAAMLIGAADPLEGSVIILPGSGLVALGAHFGGSAQRRRLWWAFGLIAAGVGIMFALSAVGGVGGSTGRSVWWALLALPYPIGWIAGLLCAILSLRGRRRIGV
jgi:hypothetical protein